MGNIQMTLRVSQELWQLMQQAMSRTTHKSANEFIRACIRAYLDETGDILGSRKHFNNRMNERMDELEALVLWNALQNQVLTARGLFTVLDELNPDTAQDPPSPEMQLSGANEAGRKLLSRFLSEQESIVRDLREHRRKRREKPS